MLRVVKKLNKRGGYVYMPKEFIGKEVEIKIIESKSVLIQKCVNTGSGKDLSNEKVSDTAPGKKEFISKWSDMRPGPGRSVFEWEYEKKFGKERVRAWIILAEKESTS